MKIDDNDNPMSVANIIKHVCAPVTDMDINLLPCYRTKIY
jgi:hypothetical protein